MNNHKLLSIVALIFGAVSFITCNSNNKKEPAIVDESRPKNFASDNEFLDFIQKKHLNYMWDGAEPTSGLAPERIHIDGIYPQNDADVITTGGSGFGIAGLVVGIERGFVPRTEGVARLHQITDYLASADRFHGVWPHWLHGHSGKVKPFSKKDNGGDLVESAFLIQGLLIVREYFKNGNENEKLLAEKIDNLWREMDWTWYLNGQDVLYWHWSPEYNWEMNFPLEGYNECLITYILAASSPTHSIPASAYHNGWARGGNIKSENVTYGYPLIFKHNGAEEYGGPLFWAHYSYIGLSPKGLSDQYADYWQLNLNQTLINYEYCVENPKRLEGYAENCWGLTASYSVNGYSAHMPGMNDLGVITPTAALSSFPYTPEQSMKALKYFYNGLGDKLWGKYGFYDAFSIEYNWYPQRYLAIDQLTIAPMIENYRTGLLWKLFMNAPEIEEGLKKLGFTYKE
ncbi:MAG: glucoamylase family protein [Proteiniphilum sp.]|nr:glucoamylase family protein [Proteiniphilum sp.]MDD3909538.1 glucoamylase family protein [Proteiniphilum sp.]MDD4415422.1 glucoamylase family protein [Proteiniphilum sp.]